MDLIQNYPKESSPNGCVCLKVVASWIDVEFGQLDIVGVVDS